jgi:hypothetical protein
MPAKAGIQGLASASNAPLDPLSGAHDTAQPRGGEPAVGELLSVTDAEDLHAELMLPRHQAGKATEARRDFRWRGDMLMTPGGSCRGAVPSAFAPTVSMCQLI